MTDSRTDEAYLELYDIMRREGPFEAKVRDALELGKEYLGVDNAHLTRIDPDTDYWEALVSTDGDEGRFPSGLVLDYETTYCRRVVSDGGSICLSNAPEQGWADDPAFETHGLHCYHGSRITVDGEPYGTVCFVSENPREQPFDERDTLFAELLTRLLEGEIERRRRTAETNRRANSVSVLSRVLRHNLRNDMTVVRGRIGQLADRLEGGSEIVEALYEDIDHIIELSDKARKLETVVSTQFEREPTALDASLDRIVTEVSGEYPGASISVEGERDVTVDAMPSLELALEEVVENAAKHAGDEPEITVEVRRTTDSVEIRVTDDGPGLPEQEREVLDEGVETPLVHGSGLGLWMVYWIVANHEGTIETTVTGAGTTVTVTLPIVETTDAFEGDDVEVLQQAVDRFEAVFEESFDAMVLVDDDRRIVDANDHAAELFGRRRSDLLGRTVGEFAADRFDEDAAWRRIVRDGDDEGRIPVIDDDGDERIVEYTASANVVPGQHLLVGRDVTERIERERALEETTTQLEAVLGTVEAAIFIKNREGRYQLMNDRCRSLLGIDSDTDVVGMTDDDIFPPEAVAQIRANDRRVLEHGETVEIEEELPTTEGVRTYLTIKSPLTDETGDITGLCAVSTDITDRKERERELRETTRRLEAVFAASPEPIFVLDADGTVELWNDAAEDVLGYSAEEVVGERIDALGMHTGDQRDRFAERFQRVLEGEQFSGLEVQRRTRDGDVVTLSVSTAPLRDGEGAVDGIVAVAEVLDDPSE